MRKVKLEKLYLQSKMNRQDRFNTELKEGGLTAYLLYFVSGNWVDDGNHSLQQTIEEQV